MKTFVPTISMLFLFGCLVIAGCSSTSIVEEETRNQVPITFRQEISRQVVNTPAELNPFSVWGWHAPSGSLSTDQAVFQTQPISVDKQGNYAQTAYWKSGYTYHFYALHPDGLHPTMTGNPQVTTGVTCTPAGQLTIQGFNASTFRGTEALDLMTACAGPLKGSQPTRVGLHFQHELTQVEVLVKTEQEIDLDFAQLKNIIYQGDFILDLQATTENARTTWQQVQRTDTVTGAPFFDHYAPGKKIHLTPTDPPVSLFGGVLLLPPQALQRASTVFTLAWSYTQPAESRVADLRIPASGIHEWKRGVRYVYTALIPPTPAPVTLTVSVKPWKKKDVNAIL